MKRTTHITPTHCKNYLYHTLKSYLPNVFWIGASYWGEQKPGFKINLFSKAVNNQSHLYTGTEMCWGFYFNVCIKIVYLAVVIKIVLWFSGVCMCVYNYTITSCALQNACN